MSTATSSRAAPSLPAFHVLPPRKFTVELPAAEFARLEAYAAFYNQSSGADEDAPSVASAILQHFMLRDRNFKRWEEKAAAAATTGGDPPAGTGAARA